MKKYISILAIAAVCVVSCKKGNVTGGDVIRSEKISGLEFRANLPSLTRTVLGTDGLSLKWTATDQIAVWSVPMGTMEEFEATATHLVDDYGFTDEAQIGIITGVETMQNGIAKGATVCETLSVTGGAGSTSATFHSEKPAREWFGNLTSIEDDMYWFSALYPASALVTTGGTAPTFTTWEMVLPKTEFGLTQDYVVRHPFFKVTVPSVQDGKSYWDYQVVYNTGLYDYGDRLARNIVSAKEVLYNEYPVTFDNWVVATSLLEFTLKAADTESYSIKTLDITYESPNYYSGDASYYDDFFALSGTVPVQFLNDEEHETLLHNRFCVPYNWYIHQGDSANGWSEMAGASPKVTLSFAEPVSLSEGNAAEGLFYAVVIPTMDMQNRTSEGKKPRIRFTAYDAAGNEILGKVLQMGSTYNYKNQREVYPGIFKGTKYSFDLELNPVTSPEAGNAGEYEEIEIVLN